MISKSRLPGQSPNCLRCRKPGYTMPADAVPVVGAKAVWSAMTGLFFLCPQVTKPELSIFLRQFPLCGSFHDFFIAQKVGCHQFIISINAEVQKSHLSFFLGQPNLRPPVPTFPPSEQSGNCKLLLLLLPVIATKAGAFALAAAFSQSILDTAPPSLKRRPRHIFPRPTQQNPCHFVAFVT